jgi:hypothetical protein
MEVTYELTFTARVTLTDPPELEVPSAVLLANFSASGTPLILVKAEVVADEG